VGHPRGHDDHNDRQGNHGETDDGAQSSGWMAPREGIQLEIRPGAQLLRQEGRADARFGSIVSVSHR
jgi:hypothetical protein